MNHLQTANKKCTGLSMWTLFLCYSCFLWKIIVYHSSSQWIPCEQELSVVFYYSNNSICIILLPRNAFLWVSFHNVGGKFRCLSKFSAVCWHQYYIPIDYIRQQLYHHETKPSQSNAWKWFNGINVCPSRWISVLHWFCGVFELLFLLPFPLWTTWWSRRA